MSSPTHKNLSALIEQPNSRWRENGDKQVETRIYVADYDTCKAAQKVKGTIGTGDLTGYVVRSSTVDPIRGMAAKLVDVWVVGGDDAVPESTPLPSDEVRVSGTNQAPKIERHPKYKSLSQDEMLLVDTVNRAPNTAQRDAAYRGLSTLGKELADLILSGNETFYLATLSYSWTTYSYTVPTMYRGGWKEAPQGPLAGSFAGSLDWLRVTDDLSYQDGIWVLTRTWLGSAGLSWSEKIYTS